MKFAALADVAELNPRETARLSPLEAIAFVPMAAVSAESASTEGVTLRPYGEVAKGYTSMRNGDLLVAKITPCFENGKIAFAALPTVVGFGSTEFHVIRARSEATDARYLLHFLRQGRIRVEGERRMTGSGGQRRVPAAFLAALEIPLPPLPEQRRIAEVLDRAETLRAQRRQALVQLDALAEAIFLDMFGDPQSNPKHWSVGTLGSIAEVASGSTPSRDAQGLYGGSIPWVKTGEVNGGQIVSTEETLTEAGMKAARCKLFPVGSIVIAMYGQGKTRGRSAVLGIPATTNQACAVLAPSRDYDTNFLHMQLTMAYGQLRAMGRGGNQENLNLGLISSFPVVLPPLVEQHRFSTSRKALDSLKAGHERSLVELNALFTSLQHRAFRGEL